MKTEENCIRGCANVGLINRGIESLKSIESQVHLTAKIMNLVGNETRLKILYLIRAEQRVCVCDMSDILGISVSAISQQLRKLKDGGLLKSQKEGQTIFYEIHPTQGDILQLLFSIFEQAELKQIA
jgi:ArsR family transcriptional regulator, lead/cadmium/zinc/bismuth-responsive transcriptional repressor